MTDVTLDRRSDDDGDDGAGLEKKSPSLTSSGVKFRRSASTAMSAPLASLRQSFLDSSSTHHRTPYRRANSAAAALPYVGSPHSALLLKPPSHPLCRALSCTRKDFFEDDTAEETAFAPPTPSCTDTQANCCQATPSPRPVAPALSSPARMPSRMSSGVDGDGSRTATVLTDVHALFPSQYAQSSNPYLRVAALELAEAGAASDGVSQAKRDAKGDGGVPAPAAHRTSAWSRTGHADPQPPPLAADDTLLKFAKRVPHSGSTVRRPPLHAPPMPRVVASRTPLKGIPLFVRALPPSHAHRSSSSSSSSANPALSLRQSIEDFSIAQLQDEAVHWYHRCNMLEKELARVEDIGNRQSKLLATHWRGGDAPVSITSRDTRAASVAHATAEDVDVDTDAPRQRTTALTSRSPDSFSRACLAKIEEEGEEEDGALAGAMLSPGSFSGEAVQTSSPPWARLAAATSLQPQTQRLIRSEGAEEDEVMDSPLRRHVFPQPTGSVVHRALSEGWEAASPSLPSSVPTGHAERGPLRSTVSAPRGPEGGEAGEKVPVEGVTERQLNFSSAQQPRSSVHSTPSPAPDAPSAVLAQQYVAVVTERDQLRVRLDAAEQETSELQERCAAQELRLDDLETQLLNKEEQLLRSLPLPQPQEGEANLSSSTPSPAHLSSLTTTPGEAREGDVRPSGSSPLLCASETLHSIVMQLHGLVNTLMSAMDDTSGGSLITGRKSETVVSPVQGVSGGPVEPDPLHCEKEASNRGVKADSPTHLPMALLPGVSASVGNDESAAVRLLTSLTQEARDAVETLSQRYAALQAELDVVRADRNDLIGGQSEQVRQLQRRLLEKETVNWKLLEELQGVREKRWGAAEELPDHPGSSKGDGQQEEDSVGRLLVAAPVLATESAVQESPPAAPAVVVASPSTESASEMEALRAKLALAQATATAAQKVQHRVFTERLEKAEEERRDAQLRAEEEYDRLTSTIETLSKKLAGAQEALRVKEVSLRIALRESFSPPLLARSPGVPALDAAIAAEDASSAAPFSSPFSSDTGYATHALTDRPWRVLHRLRDDSATASPSPEWQSSAVALPASAFPDPPARAMAYVSVPLPPPHILVEGTVSTLPGDASRKISKQCERNDDNNNSDNRGDDGVSTRTTPPLQRFEGDGTLRALPSDIPDDLRKTLQDREREVSPYASSATIITGSTSITINTTRSSRDRSSHGLSTSVGGRGSHSFPSQPRDHDAGDQAAASSHVDGIEVPTEAPAVEPLPKPFLWQRGQLQLESSRQAAMPTTTAAATSASSPQRRSFSARRADTLADEEAQLPLPMPLRGPLFPSETSSASTSPDVARMMPSHRSAASQKGRLALAHSAGMETRPPVQRSVSQHETLSDVAFLRGGSQTPEERVRSFFASLSALSPLETDAYPGTASSGERAIALSERAVSSRELFPCRVDGAPLPAQDAGRSSAAWLTGTAMTAALDNAITPGRSPRSLFPGSASSSVASTPAAPQLRTPLSASPHCAEVAERHVRTSLRRHREVWQQQKLILQSLLTTPTSTP